MLHRFARHAEALACYERALELNPAALLTELNKAHALESLGAVGEAIDCLRDVLTRHPDDVRAMGSLASCAFRLCAWDLAESLVTRLCEAPEGVDAIHPFLRFAVELDPAVLYAAARRTASAIEERVPEKPLAAHRHDRLRIAYLSPDFREHPVAHALAGVIEVHDRQQIECFGVSLARSDESEVAARLRSSFDHFIDCSAMADTDVVDLMREREIDVAIDLAGHTTGARPEAFAARLAPVQVNFLGFAGSTGARYIDYIIADEIVIPTGEERYFSEKILRLADCYLPFNRNRVIEGASPSRIEEALPSDGFVLCGFSNGYKISRPMFNVWLKLLEAVPGSVLWLRGGDRALEKNLTDAALGAGVPARRLVFAKRVSRIEQHLARLQLADLFLDTAPYNAHTTGAEALWAGVPVITCRGQSFAGRVGASLLTAAGTPDMICESLPEYFERALQVAEDPRRRAKLRERILSARDTAPIFDTRRYVRGFEAALLQISRQRNSGPSGH
jgi:predicted O-linked N-acetylglucosamine transferase (SPINDLY family)